MNDLDIQISYRLLAVTWHNKWHLEFLESFCHNLGDAAGNETQKTKASAKDTLVLSAIFAQPCLLAGYCYKLLCERHEMWKGRFLGENECVKRMTAKIQMSRA